MNSCGESFRRRPRMILSAIAIGPKSAGRTPQSGPSSGTPGTPGTRCSDDSRVNTFFSTRLIPTMGIAALSVGLPPRHG